MWAKWIVYWLASAFVVGWVLYQMIRKKSRFAAPPFPGEEKKNSRGKTKS